ncbi:DUF4189 domain-containing protein [Bacillus sp. NP157]|nr:DUF4189 domain-containing protein [Bacillus sp. NP157]
MKAKLILATGLALASALPAVASAQCATGVDTGGGNCIPPEALPGAQSNTAQPGPPQPAWINKFGIVVIDTKTSAIGVADNMDSERSALAKAVAQCESFGGKQCDDRMPYSNQCIALSWGSGGYGVSRKDDSASAASQAMSQCEGVAPGCRIVYQACSKAIRLR